MFRISVIAACNNISCTYIVVEASVPAVVAAVVPAVVPAATVIVSATYTYNVHAMGVLSFSLGKFLYV